MKPDKWGIKFYVLAESESSYVLNMRICGEKCTLEKTETDLTAPYNHKNWKLFMDTYYNSFAFSFKLHQLGIYTCGTLGLNRNGPKELIKIKKTNQEKWNNLFF